MLREAQTRARDPAPPIDGETALRPRRPSRLRRKNRQMWAIQHHRLRQIAERRIEPHFEREHMFLWTLQARGQAHPADFILPGLLFMAESLTNPLERIAAWADDDDDAASPAPSP